MGKIKAPKENIKNKKDAEGSDEDSKDAEGSDSESEGSDSDSPILCKCNNEARRLTVKKEGKNQGKVFYQCTKFAGKCGFFKWEEDLNTKVKSNPTEKNGQKRELEIDENEEKSAKK